jgi:hypothetical protein
MGLPPVVLFAVLLELVAVLALAFIAWAYPADRDI